MCWMQTSCWVASFPGRRRNGNFCESKLYMDVTSWQLQYLNIFSSCENGAFLLVEAAVCCWFYYWSETEVIRTKSSCRVPTLAQSRNLFEMERAWLWWFHAWRNWVLLLSCDNILKFDRYRQLSQLSSSRSNSLNLQKLPDCFSYGLGTRLLAENVFAFYPSLYFSALHRLWETPSTELWTKLMAM